VSTVAALAPQTHSAQRQVYIIKHDQKILSMVPKDVSDCRAALIHPTVRFYQQQFFVSDAQDGNAMALLSDKSLLRRFCQFLDKNTSCIMSCSTIF